MVSTQLDEAKQRLFGKDGLDAANFKLFPGSNREVTAEQIAEEINKSLARVEAGEFTEPAGDDE